MAGVLFNFDFPTEGSATQAMKTLIDPGNLPMTAVGCRCHTCSREVEDESGQEERAVEASVLENTETKTEPGAEISRTRG